MVSSNPIIAPPSTHPISKPLGIDFDANKISIELIVTMVLVKVGMDPMQNNMKQIAEQQQIQDKLDSSLIDLAALISKIETAASSDPTGNSNNMSQLQTQLKTLLTNIFGTPEQVSIDAGGHFWPASGSELGQFLKSLGGVNDPSAYNNPVYALFNTLGKDLYSNTGSISGPYASGQPVNGNYNWNNSGTLTESIAHYIFTDSSGFQSMIEIFSGAYYLANHPNTVDQSGKPVTGNFTNTLNNLYNDSSSGQSGLQGLGTENTTKVQTDTTSLNSLDQAGQAMISNMTQAKQAWVNNQKSS